MLIDGIELTEGSILKNPTLARGPQFPDSPDAGELFFNTSMLALCIYTGYDWSELGAVKSVAGKSGVVLLDVNDVSGAFAANKVGVADGAAALNSLGQVPDEQVNTYNKTEIDLKVQNAGVSQYHSTPYDIASAIVNKPSGSAKVLRFAAPRAFTLITDAVGSIFRAGTVSAGNAVFGVFKNDTQIGTITFGTGAAIATCSITQTTFGVGDILGIVAPPVQDTKLADIMFTISAQL